MNVRRAVYLVGAAVSMAACAGSSVRHEEAQDDGQSGGTAGVDASGGAGRGGSPVGGSVSDGGSVALGGGAGDSMTGGASGVGAGGIAGGPAGGVAGSVAGAGGISGAGGEPVSDPFLDCLKPAESGPCTAILDRFAFNPVTLACEPFVWGGCGGNENRFESLEDCSAACVARLPKDCTPSSRGPGCPCGPNVGQCSRTSCSSAPYELGYACQPSDVMLCSRGGAKGGCWCDPSTGDEGCGV